MKDIHRSSSNPTSALALWHAYKLELAVVLAIVAGVLHARHENALASELREEIRQASIGRDQRSQLASSPVREGDVRVTHVSSEELARLAEACGTRAAMLSASPDAAAIEPVNNERSAEHDAAAVRAYAEAESVLAQAVATGRWTEQSRDSIMTHLDRLPEHAYLELQERILAHVHDGSLELAVVPPL